VPLAQVVFLAETALASLVRRGYFLRMYFWIDIVATLSMALDITALMDAITHDVPGVPSPLNEATFCCLLLKASEAVSATGCHGHWSGSLCCMDNALSIARLSTALSNTAAHDMHCSCLW